MQEWIRISHHCPVTLDALLAMPRWERLMLHLELSQWLEDSEELARAEAAA